MRKSFILIILLNSFVSLAQQSGTITDTRDGKVYKTVVIGTQTWMAENLNVATFRNGDPIPEAKTQEEWQKAGREGRPAWCYYDFNAENGKVYGKIYNRYAVNDPRDLAPIGWKIPKLNDWRVLEKNVNNLYYSKLIYSTGSIIDQQLMSKEYWFENENGTNETGFNALPSGYHEGNYFEELGQISYFWCKDSSYNGVYMRRSSQESIGVIQTGSCKDGFEGDGFAVRCLIEKQFYFSEKEKNEFKKNKYFEGMVYIDTIKANIFPYNELDKPIAEDSTFFYSRGQLKDDIKPFYISDHEVTNGEYREFIHWVRDSIVREKLVYRCARSDIQKWATYVDYDSGKKDATGKYFILNWDTKLDYEDPMINPLFSDIYMPRSERFNSNRKELDIRLLQYKYNDEEGLRQIINIYPDTLCWLLGPYKWDIGHVYATYFWNPAYYDYPVVGLTFSQAKAYCYWRTQMYLREMGSSKIRRKQGIRFRLPNEHEWMLASRGYKKTSDESYRFDYNGLNRNSDGTYNSNFGKDVSRSGLIRKWFSDDNSMYTSKVRSYEPNSNELYCIFGNVSEWIDEIPKQQNFYINFLKYPSRESEIWTRKNKEDKNYVYITDPYIDSTYLVEKNSEEHIDLVYRRLAFYEIYPNDSYETVKSKYFQLNSIPKEFETKVESLNLDSNKTFPSFCERHGLKLYDFVKGKFYYQNCIENYNEFDDDIYLNFEKFKHNYQVLNRASSYAYTLRNNPLDNCRMVKGGSWAHEPHYLLIDNSEVRHKWESSSTIGFRVACDASEELLTKKEIKKRNKVRKLKIW